MRQTSLALFLLLAGGCAPTNFAELAAQTTVSGDELNSPAERIRAGQLALLGGSDIGTSERLLASALKRRDVTAGDKLAASISFAYLGVLEGRPDWVREAVEAGLPHAGADDAELLMAVLRSYWGSFSKGGPVPDSLTQVINAAQQRQGDAWACARLEAEEQLRRASRLQPKSSVELKVPNSSGLLTSWRVSAPWSTDPFVDLEKKLGPEASPLESVSQLTLGYQAEARASWLMSSSDGEIYFYDIPESGGIGFAQTFLEFADVPTDRRVMLVIESNRPTRVFAAGQEVASLHRSSHTEGWTKRVEFILPKKGGLVSLKMASEDGSGFVRLRANSMVGAVLRSSDPNEHLTQEALETTTLAGLKEPECIEAAVKPLGTFPNTTDMFRTLLRLEVLNGRPYRDTRQTRRILRHLDRLLPKHPALLAAKTRLLANDPSLGRSLSRSKRQTVVKRLLERWPNHVPSLNLLAKLQWSDSLVAEAVRTWKRALSKRPNDRPTLVALLSAYAKKGWRHESLDLARRLESLPISGPRVMQEVFDVYQRFGQSQDADRVSALLLENFRLSALTRRARYLGAGGETGPIKRAHLLLELWRAKPDRLDAARRAFELFLGGQDFGQARKVLERLGKLRPDDLWTQKAWLSLSLQGHGKSGVTESLRALKVSAVGDSGLEQLSHWLMGSTSELVKIKDGKEVVATFLSQRGDAADDPYSAYPIVNLLDSTNVAVLADGGVWILTHVVRLVQTKSGVDKIGEIRPPPGSMLVELRTIKANGDVLWPERVAGKDDISFSGLVPGDAVEWAWLRRDEVRQSEGGYLTGLAFSQWGIPTRAKRASIVLAPNLNPVLRVRNGAPTPKLRALSDGATQLFWEEQDLPPMSREPRAASARLFFPFVDVAVQARNVASDGPWDRIRHAYSAHVRERLRRGWRASRRIASFQRASMGLAPLKAVASWIQREIKGSERFNRFTSTLEEALARGKGNRSLVLTGLAQEMGFDASLVLCLPEPHGPHTDARDPIPNANRYWYPLVRTKVGEKTLFIDVNDASTPFGQRPASLQGARCMSLAPDGDLFVSLPRAVDATRPWRMVLTVDVDELGGARLQFHGQGRGPVTNALRQVYGRSDEARRRLVWQQWLSWMIPGARLVDFDVSGADDPNSDFRFKIQASAGGLFVKESKRLVASNLMKGLWAKHFSTFPDLKGLVALPDRDTPLQFESHREEFQLHLRVPPTHRIETILQNVDVQSSKGEIRGSQRIESGGTGLRLTRTFDAKGAILEVEDYPDFRREVLRFEEAIRGSITLIPIDP